MKNIKFYLQFCDHDCGCEEPSAKTHTVFGKVYPGDFRGEVGINYKIEGEGISFSIPELGISPTIGNVSDMAAVSIRICNQEASVYAIFDDPEKTALAMCCGGGGCRCYANWCSC